MRLIPLDKGKFAKVDDEDFERVSKHDWKAVAARNGTANPYAKTWIKGKGQLYMHHLVRRRKTRTDHKDGDSLNNQKYNLRSANAIQNGRNRKIQIHSAPYKGVSFFKPTGRWQGRASKNGNNVHLGYFSTPELAASAYDSYARTHYGEFSRTNQQIGVL
jgi:hypothetical protein